MMSHIRAMLFAAAAILLLPLQLIALAQDKTVVEMWAEDNEWGECTSSWYTDNYPGEEIEIQVVLLPQFVDATRTALQGGAGPDIVQTHGPSFMLELAEAGLLVPLDEYAEKYAWADRFAPWALNLGTYEGQLYGLSDELESMVMWYNATLFEQKGWQIPTTMDELFELAQTIEDAGIVPFGPAFASECPPCLEWYVGVFLNHYAGPDLVYEALTGQRPWTDPAFVEAITKLNEMMQNDWLMGGKDYFFSDTSETAHAMFGAGEIAINFEGTWMQGSMSDFFGPEAGNENDWDWFPIPTTFSEDPFYLIGVGSSWSLNAATENRDAAAEVLDYVFSPATQAGVFEACGKSPAPMAFEADMFANTDPRMARFYESFGQASEAGNVGYTTWSFWPAKTNVYLYEGIALVYDGQLSVEDYLAEMDRIFQGEFAEGAIPPIPAR